ncbi:hypothetical protein JCM10908_004474 [Rhodotorula pacifica]|uniref:uncharacterized protein n=1 Tax=Rhodotorula pacifica TaxID=1495444 RepID=UPI003177F398
MARNVVNEMNQRGSVVGPSAYDPQETSWFTGCSLHMWQLTPVLEGMRWPLPQGVHAPPRQVEWACKVTPLAMNSREQTRQRANVQATILCFTLNWPPLDLAQAVTPISHALVPTARQPNQHAHVLLPLLLQHQPLLPAPIPHDRLELRLPPPPPNPGLFGLGANPTMFHSPPPKYIPRSERDA